MARCDAAWCSRLLCEPSTCSLSDKCWLLASAAIRQQAQAVCICTVQEARRRGGDSGGEEGSRPASRAGEPHARPDSRAGVCILRFTMRLLAQHSLAVAVKPRPGCCHRCLPALRLTRNCPPAWLPHAGGSAAPTPVPQELPREEVIRRLRALGEPVTLFAETDEQRFQRMLLAEQNVQVGAATVGGWVAGLQAGLQVGGWEGGWRVKWGGLLVASSHLIVTASHVPVEPSPALGRPSAGAHASQPGPATSQLWRALGQTVAASTADWPMPLPLLCGTGGGRGARRRRV